MAVSVRVTRRGGNNTPLGAFLEDEAAHEQIVERAADLAPGHKLQANPPDLHAEVGRGLRAL